MGGWIGYQPRQGRTACIKQGCAALTAGRGCERVLYGPAGRSRAGAAVLLLLCVHGLVCGWHLGGARGQLHRDQVSGQDLRLLANCDLLRS